MKINDILNNSPKNIDIGIKDSNRSNQPVKNLFNEELDKMSGLSVKEKLGTLLTKIDEQSNRISRNMDIREVVVYKKLISEFLKESVDSMVKFSKNSFLDRRGRHRVYAIIKKVDEEIEKLTEDVLKKEKDNIKIIKRLDDIRGLILDIYL